MLSGVRTTSVSLHGFCDASSVAYGAAVYLRTHGSTHTTLVIAKAHVLSVKPITIPRAELLGAHLLAKLLSHTCSVLAIPSGLVHAWTDSEIVLHWLPKTPPQLDRFVANRVYSIQQLLPDVIWRHVSTQDNPTYLFYCVPIKPCLRLPEVQSEFLHFLWSRFSSFFMLIRIVGWIFRFVHNCSKDRDHRRFDLLDYDEVVASKHLIYKLSQQEFFPEVFLAIQQSKNLPRGHTLSKFIVTLSPHGHLLVCSRVRDPEAPTSPMKLTVLSPKSKLTKLLVTTLHRTYQHAGITVMSSILANSYYIPSLRNLLKLISRTCVSCQRAYARPLQHIMGMLPFKNHSCPSLPSYRCGFRRSLPVASRTHPQAVLRKDIHSGICVPHHEGHPPRPLFLSIH